MARFLSHFLKNRIPRKRLKSPLWPRVIYVEISYQCNLHCRMCPRDFDSTPQVSMSPAVFQRALPALQKTEYIDFSGWGETLLSPNAIEYIHSAATRDFQCGVSTNGLLLRDSLAEQLLDGNALYMNVSIDGGSRDIYRQVRGKDRFDKAIENLEAFVELRNRRNSRTTVEWIFVMMKSNFRDMPKAVELACKLGVDKFTGKHLELAATRDFLSEALWDTPYSPDVPEVTTHEFTDIVEQCRQMAEGKLLLSIHPLIHTKEFWEQTGPFFKMFLNHEGYVTACSFISPNNHRPFSDPPFHKDWIWGNVMDTPLEEIVESRRSLEFQQMWMKRCIPPACGGCPFSFRLDKDGFCHAL